MCSSRQATHAACRGNTGGMSLRLLLVLGGLFEGDAFVPGGSQLPRLRRQLHTGSSRSWAPPTMNMVEDIVSLPRRYERWPLGDSKANPTNVQRPFSGLRGDIALRLPTYLDDWRAGLQAKTVGATLFLYFACLAPVVAFGGALQLATQGNLGIIECIISRGVCGMAYAVLAGQPMTFIGSAACEMRPGAAAWGLWAESGGPTGLTLTFTTALYAWAAPKGVPFLPMYAWVGLWTSGFLLTAACTNLAGLIRYCTRFTEEVFNSFLGSTYIWSACSSLYGQLSVAALAAAGAAAGAGVASSSALLSLVLAGLTLGLCQASSDLSTSRYFTERARSFVADFGPACSVALVSTFSASRAVRLLADVPRLALPTGAITMGRPLLVPLLALPLKYRLLAALPAVFLSILFFLDQNITVRTVNSPVNKLLPRPTYHLDLFILGLLTAATSLCGLPWMCAATVESINHVRSMTVYKKPPQTEDLVSPAELDERERADLRMMFDSLDEGKTGSISSDKLVSLLRSRSLLEGELLTTAEAARQAAGVLQRFDQSGDGKLQFPEFVSLCVASAKGEEVAPNPALDNGDENDDDVEISVVETRLSGFLVHAMVLGTLSCVSSLRVVPIAVVNGVFLYLGRKVMQGNQFLQRLRALTVPLPLDLDTKSPAERSILVLGRDAAMTFTGLQLACLATLWALKLTPGLGMVFPAAIGALMFMRAQLLPRVFTRRQLGVIDTPIWNIRRTEEEAAASLATAKNATAVQKQVQ